MDSPADRAETIASAAESPTAARSRQMLAVAIVVLAATAAGATLVATNYHHEVTRLRAHPPTVATLSAVPSPVRVSTSAVATDAAAISPTTVSPVASAPPLSVPPLTARAFELAMARPHVTVYLTAAAADGVGVTDGQLLVTALVHGGQPGARYSLAGGDCDLPTDVEKVWAQGTADTAGTALLTGPTWTLPKADQYTLFFETLAPGATTSVTGAGLSGVFLLSGLLNPRQPGQTPCLYRAADDNNAKGIAAAAPDIPGERHRASRLRIIAARRDAFRGVTCAR